MMEVVSHGEIIVQLSARANETVGDANQLCRALCNQWTRCVYGAFECEATASEALVSVSYAYYHIRRILKRMLTPLPGEEGFDKYSNCLFSRADQENWR